MKARISFGRTISVRQFEPERVEVEVEVEVPETPGWEGFVERASRALFAVGDALVSERLAFHAKLPAGAPTGPTEPDPYA